MKLGILGAGAVGTSCAQWAVVKEVAEEIVLIDIVPGLAQGKALDLAQSLPLLSRAMKVEGTEDFSALSGSEVVIITAGRPRTPGMSREDLLRTNAEIVKSCAECVKRYAKDSVVIVVSNPLDAMVYVTYKTTGFSRERVIGMAGVLDSARFRYFLAQALGVSSSEVIAPVLGIHGDYMVPLVRFANLSGLPVEKLLPPERIEEIVKRTKQGGAEVVSLLKTGSAFITPGLATVEMAEAILKDRKKVLTCSVLLDGEYGISGVFLGVPVVLGRGGVEKIIEVELLPEEKEAFLAGAKACQELISKL